MAIVRPVRTVDTVGVALARADIWQVAVPVERAALGHLDPRLVVSIVEQAELTRSACSLNSEKFVPPPSQFAPRGNG